MSHKYTRTLQEFDQQFKGIEQPTHNTQFVHYDMTGSAYTCVNWFSQEAQNARKVKEVLEYKLMSVNESSNTYTPSDLQDIFYRFMSGLVANGTITSFTINVSPLFVVSITYQVKLTSEWCKFSMFCINQQIKSVSGMKGVTPPTQKLSLRQRVINWLLSFDKKDDTPSS